jgi:hypothetical protein
MMLRASVNHVGGQADLRAIVGGSDEGDDSLAHRDLLVTFADACVRGEPESLIVARRQLADATGAAFAVDAAAVVANFEMMTRVADTTGAAYADGAQAATADARAVTGADDFESARWG